MSAMKLGGQQTSLVTRSPTPSIHCRRRCAPGPVLILAATGKHQQGRPAAVKTASSSASLSSSPPKRAALKDPAHLQGASISSVTVSDRGGELGLDRYMRLPPEEYSQLDPSMISSLGGNRFRLNVPRISLFNLWVQPTVDVVVTLPPGQPPKVVLMADACQLVGSDAVQRMRLGERFTLHFVTQLTWTPEGLSSNKEGTITGDLQVQVATEVISPFHLLPRSVLEGTCNGVLRQLIRSLLPLFMKKLAQDYERWATDPEYRARRGG